MYRPIKLGVDPAGEGVNKTRWVLRDNFKAQLVATENKSDAKSVAQKTLSIMEYFNVESHNVYVDNFGVGANVVQELAIAGRAVNGINVGDKPEDGEKYLNLRAEAYYRIKNWIRSGGELIDHNKWKELLTIRIKPNLKGKLQVMPKEKMLKQGHPSPDIADALMLTFVEDDIYGEIVQQVVQETFDEYSPL